MSGERRWVGHAEDSLGGEVMVEVEGEVEACDGGVEQDGDVGHDVLPSVEEISGGAF